MTVDKVSAGSAFQLDWTTVGENNDPAAPVSTGFVSFQEQNNGIYTTNWSSNPPPSSFPVLCASIAQCGNSLSSTYYNVIWGSRAPTLVEPLLQGTTWPSTGGAGNDVASVNDYAGTEQITVPAFPQPVLATKVRSQITQAGALGDPYGSGVRTVWWVYGVGPAKVEFDHTGGAVTTAVLQSTNLTPAAPPSDANYFPLTVGLKGKFSWTNSKYMKRPEIQSYSIDQAAPSAASSVTVLPPNPAAPAISAPPAATISPLQTLSGTGVAGDQITLYDGSTAIGTAIVASNGTWSLAVTLALGPHTLTATQTDTVWNLTSVLSSSVSITVYTQPVPPAISSASVGSVSFGAATVTVRGTGVAGETITVYDGSNAVGTATVAANGTWTLSVRLASGSHTLTATQTLTAGATSNASAGFIVTVPSH